MRIARDTRGSKAEDPISLAILLDPRPPQSDLLAKMNQGLSSLAASSLTSRDRVSIFLMGCSSMQVVEDLPPDPSQLRSAVDSILQTRAAKDSNGKKIDCKENPRLWDALAFATHKMEDKPGRRTILAVTNGDEKGSKIAPLDLITLAQLSGVTIFALDPANHLNGSASFRTSDEQILSATRRINRRIAIGIGGDESRQRTQIVCENVACALHRRVPPATRHKGR